MHVRAQIRKVIAELMRSTQTAGGNVFPSRMFSLDETELPSISVYTTDDANIETVQRTELTKLGPLMYRLLPVIIEGHALMDERIDDILDDIAVEIEKAMAMPVMVAGKEISTQLISTQTTFSGEGDEQVGVLRLIYSVSYSAKETTPDSLS